MKIIKQTDFSNWKYRFTCSKCSSELEAEPTDVIVTVSSDSGHYAGSSFESYSVKCPICHKDTNILPDKIPEVLKIFAKNRNKGL